MTQLYVGSGFGRRPVGEMSPDGFIFQPMGEARRLVGFVDFGGNIFQGSEPDQLKKIGEVHSDGFVYGQTPWGWEPIGEVGDNGVVYAGTGMFRMITGEVELRGGLGSGFALWDFLRPPDDRHRLRSGAALLFLATLI